MVDEEDLIVFVLDLVELQPLLDEALLFPALPPLLLEPLLLLELLELLEPLELLFPPELLELLELLFPPELELELFPPPLRLKSLDLREAGSERKGTNIMGGKGGWQGTRKRQG